MSGDSRKQFVDLITAASKNKNSPYLLSESQYGNTLNELRAASEKKTRKTDHEYRLLNRYSIVKVDDVEKLIEKRMLASDPVRYVVPIEQVSS
jgi:hypothetical protein